MTYRLVTATDFLCVDIITTISLIHIITQAQLSALPSSLAWLGSATDQATWMAWSVRHFGTSADMSGQFGTSAGMSWVRSVSHLIRHRHCHVKNTTTTDRVAKS